MTKKRDESVKFITVAIVLTLMSCATAQAVAPVIVHGYGGNGPSKWATEEAERISREEVEAQKRREEEAAAKQQAEANAQHEKEEELEASRKQQEHEIEAAEKQGTEEQRATPTAPAACIVPALAGDSLPKARRALRKAHCRLGKVSYRKAHGLGTPIVIAEHPRDGARLKAKSAVAVTVRHGARR